jgi:fibronectin-binding autotransporter adhesin
VKTHSLAFLIFGAAGTLPLLSADFSWDGDSVTANAQYGPAAGVWTSAPGDLSWLPGNTTTGTLNQPWVNSTGNVAQFKSGTAGTVPVTLTLSLGENIDVGKIDVGGSFAPNLIITNSGANTFTLNAGAANFSLAPNNGSKTLTIDVVINGSNGLTKINVGKAILTKANAYTGTTTVSAGILEAGAAASGQAFGNLSAVTLANVAGTALALNNFNQTIGSLAGGGTTGGNVTLGTATLTTGGNNTDTTFAGVISGTGGGLNKTGSGSLSLSGTNTYTGGTTITGGTLRLGNTAGAGTGLIQVNNGTLSLSRSGVIPATTTTYTNPITSVAATSGALVLDGSGSNEGTGTNSIYATGTITVNGTLSVSRPTGGNGHTAFTSLLTGSGTLVINNTNGGVAPSNTALGRAQFSNASNTFNGTVQIASGGNFMDSGVASPSYAAVDIAAGGFHSIIGNRTTTIGILTGAGSITKNTSSDTATLAVSSGNFSGVIAQNLLNATGTVALTKNGAGTLILSGANTYGGLTTVNAGILRISSNDALGAIGTGTPRTSIPGDVSNSGRVELSGGITTGETFELGGRQGVTIDAPHISNFSGDNIITGQLRGVTGGGVYNVESQAGLLTLAGGITQGAGTGTRTWKLMGAGEGVVSGVISNGTAALAIQKIDGGIWAFTNNNTYSGQTTISGGKLLINNNAIGSGTGTGPVVVQNGGTLGGTGFIGTSVSPVNVTIQSGGTLAPGNSPETLTHFGSFTMNPGSLFEAELAFGGVAGAGDGTDGTDRLVVNGSVTINDAILFPIWGGQPTNIFQGGTLTADHLLWLIVNDDDVDLIGGTGFVNDGVFVNTGLQGLFGGSTSPYLVNGGGGSYALFYDANFTSGLPFGGNDLLLIAIPEPSRALLVLMALLPVAMRRQRR